MTACKSCKYVSLLQRLRPLSSFVVESVAARLQFAGLHATVRSFGDDGRPRKEKLDTDPAQVDTPLVARCPAEKRRGHTQTSHVPVFADADAVAVQPHRHTPVGIAGMYEVLRQLTYSHS